MHPCVIVCLLVTLLSLNSVQALQIPHSTTLNELGEFYNTQNYFCQCTSRTSIGVNYLDIVGYVCDGSFTDDVVLLRVHTLQSNQQKDDALESLSSIGSKAGWQVVQSLHKTVKSLRSQDDFNMIIIIAWICGCSCVVASVAAFGAWWMHCWFSFFCGPFFPWMMMWAPVTYWVAFWLVFFCALPFFLTSTLR
eukprot:gnl/TRDRNA2_/TRDRNA2_158995_c0_seq1.p1 gnl/TRDRNA2_/TRDRNA2_158995_c0~~gnl/TRDRNA2_/TRDRNA2_158995_c0_seq1.p1  ORF type:complete len:193 (-),score=15.98 gnl/TRDRNA2_/TRDRNA2_158995_c0_seq1:167-745(-)